MFIKKNLLTENNTLNQKDNKNLQESKIDQTTSVIQNAIDILNRFFMAFRTARIYEPNNLLLLRQIKAITLRIKSCLNTEEEACFILRQSSLYFNAIKLKFGYSNYYLFKFINQEFKKRDISVLRFHSGLTVDELEKFIFLLSKKENQSNIQFDEFNAEFKKIGFLHISIEKSPDELSGSNEKNASKIFFLSITHLKDIFTSKEENGRPFLLTTRRLMQSLLNNIMENESFLHGLTNIKNFDEYTLNHSVNVCILSLSLGKRLGLERNELVNLGISAFVHDFGKVDIPLDILVKPSTLDEIERKIIEKHPQYGAERLMQIQEFHSLPSEAFHVAMEHHFREDKNGYPRYVKKEDTHLFSKIVKITDYFDAVTTRRPYRKKIFTRTEALNLMLEKIGIEFDPIILKAFVQMMGAYPVGSVVLLDTGEIGIVHETNPEPVYMLRPKVKLIADSAGKKINGPIIDLTETDVETNKYRRTIVKSLDSEKYNIHVPDYFIAQVQ